MRWTDPGPRWRKWFAVLPITVGRQSIWLEWYWAKSDGECVAISFDEPGTIERLARPREAP